MHRYILSALLIGTVGCTVAAQTGATPAANHRDTILADHSAAGAYTPGQATAGKTAYNTFCLSCHEPSFHSDEQFRFNWFGRSVYELFRTVKTTMPEDNPGGIPDEAYVRVIAYILQLNGLPPGADSLIADSTRMRHLIIAPPDSALPPAADTSAASDSTRHRLP